MQYMVDITLPVYSDENYYQLLPQQKEHISSLMNNGIILSFSLSADRSKIWATVKAVSEESVINILSEFPIYSYLKYSVTPLAINTVSNKIPPISMN
ncbi:MAG: muconolactone Delta-isomerase family protein [Cytophagaceae bacterium]